MSNLHTKEFEDLIDHLKRIIGINNFTMEEENSCTLIGEDMYLSLINQEGILFFVTLYENLEQYNNKESIKDFILNSNVLFHNTKGCTFGLSEENVITLCYKYPLSALSKESFIDKLENFLEVKDKFATKFKEIEQNTDKNSSLEVISEENFLMQNWQKI